MIVFAFALEGRIRILKRDVKYAARCSEEQGPEPHVEAPFIPSRVPTVE